VVRLQEAVSALTATRAPPTRLNSRVTGARLEVEQLTKQLSQNQIQLASAKDTLAMNQQILNDIQPLAKIGHSLDSIPEAATGSTLLNRNSTN